jgi:hypothetical protein
LFGHRPEPGQAGSRPVEFSFLGSIDYLNTLKTQDKSLKYSENLRTSARLSVVCSGFSMLQVTGYGPRGFICSWCVLWNPDVSWRSELFVDPYTANIAGGLDGCGHAGSVVAKTNAPNRMRHPPLKPSVNFITKLFKFLDTYMIGQWPSCV